jgi:hypothetical protein
MRRGRNAERAQSEGRATGHRGSSAAKGIIKAEITKDPGPTDAPEPAGGEAQAATEPRPRWRRVFER